MNSRRDKGDSWETSLSCCRLVMAANYGDDNSIDGNENESQFPKFCLDILMFKY